MHKAAWREGMDYDDEYATEEPSLGSSKDWKDSKVQSIGCRVTCDRAGMEHKRQTMDGEALEKLTEQERDYSVE
jgi:hypothetical protein